MRLPFGIRVERQVEVHLYVELGLQSGRLADLVQLLAKSDALITDLKPDRTYYPLGMPERSAEVTFVVASLQAKKLILKNLATNGFTARELS